MLCVTCERFWAAFAWPLPPPPPPPELIDECFSFVAKRDPRMYSAPGCPLGEATFSSLSPFGGFADFAGFPFFY